MAGPLNPKPYDARRRPANRRGDRQAARGGRYGARRPRVHLCRQPVGVSCRDRRDGHHLRPRLPGRSDFRDVLLSSHGSSGSTPSFAQCICRTVQWTALATWTRTPARVVVSTQQPRRLRCNCTVSMCVRRACCRRAAQGGAATRRTEGCLQRQRARQGSARPGPHLRHPAGHGAACAILVWTGLWLRCRRACGVEAAMQQAPGRPGSIAPRARCAAATVGAMPAPCCWVGATAAFRILAQAAAAACQAAQNLGPITITALSAACHI